LAELRLKGLPLKEAEGGTRPGNRPNETLGVATTPLCVELLKVVWEYMNETKTINSHLYPGGPAQPLKKIYRRLTADVMKRAEEKNEDRT